MQGETFEIFLVTLPGLEEVLADEARDLEFEGVAASAGGVICHGSWVDVWRANIQLRCAVRVLVRFASFRAMHLAQLDKRASRLDWAALFPPGLSLRVEAVCRKSRIYHARAAAERVERAICQATDARISADSDVRVLVRIEDDLCTLSLDTTGQPLHRRGHKQAVGKAPLRETMAAAFLRRCGFDGMEPVLDPMCGSGTFVLEAAEISAGLQPGRSRSFAFEQVKGVDPEGLAALKTGHGGQPVVQHVGSDRDQGVVGMARRNAAQAGVADRCRFECRPVRAIEPPEGGPGLVMVNPPYGARIGNRKALFSLYGALGAVLRERFQGWRVGLVTSDGGLARATMLPFLPSDPPVAHGGLKVTLWRTAALE